MTGPRFLGTASLLRDARVLVVGAWSSSGDADTVEVFELR